MSETIETVRVEATNPEEQGFYILVNKADFDKKTMKLYDGPDNPAPEPPAPLVPGAPPVASDSQGAAVVPGQAWGAPPAA